MSLDDPAQHIPLGYPIESSTEEITIRIPKGTSVTVSYSSSTPNESLPSTPGLDSGIARSHLDQIILRVKNLSLMSYHDAALEGDYTASPIEVALRLMHGDIMMILEAINVDDWS